MSTDASQKRYLTRLETRKLEDWVLAQRLEIEKTKPTRQVLAARAAEVIGRRVSPKQIGDCMAVVGISYAPSKSKAGGGAVSRHRCDTLLALCRTMEALHTQLGFPLEVAIAKALREPGWLGEASVNPPTLF